MPWIRKKKLKAMKDEIKSLRKTLASITIVGICDEKGTVVSRGTFTVGHLCGRTEFEKLPEEVKH